MNESFLLNSRELAEVIVYVRKKTGYHIPDYVYTILRKKIEDDERHDEMANLLELMINNLESIERNALLTNITTEHGVSLIKWWKDRNQQLA